MSLTFNHDDITFVGQIINDCVDVCEYSSGRSLFSTREEGVKTQLKNKITKREYLSKKYDYIYEDLHVGTGSNKRKVMSFTITEKGTEDIREIFIRLLDFISSQDSNISLGHLTFDYIKHDKKKLKQGLFAPDVHNSIALKIILMKNELNDRYSFIKNYVLVPMKNNMGLCIFISRGIYGVNTKVSGIPLVAWSVQKSYGHSGTFTQIDAKQYILQE
jgi:hypothetical protein